MSKPLNSAWSLHSNYPSCSSSSKCHQRNV